MRVDIFYTDVREIGPQSETLSYEGFLKNSLHQIARKREREKQKVSNNSTLQKYADSKYVVNFGNQRNSEVVLGAKFKRLLLFITKQKTAES